MATATATLPKTQGGGFLIEDRTPVEIFTPEDLTDEHRAIARTAEEGRLADEDPTVDLADKAANSYTKEFLFGMTNTDRTILNMIEAALKRIQKEEYGVCANCQDEMQQKRLEAVPWAKHCITCQEKAEKGQL